MPTISTIRKTTPLFSWIGCLLITSTLAVAQQPVKLTLDLEKPGAAVSPTLYGLMTEEINHSYDGGLYAELISNRVFKDSIRKADHWSVVQDEGGVGTISLDKQALNEDLPVSLRLIVENPGKRVGIANDGYWGIPVKPATLYKGSFYAKTTTRSGGSPARPLTISIESRDGKTIYATAKVDGISGQWQRYAFSLTTAKDISPTADTRFVITAEEAGNWWFNLVSLFPPTFNDRANGNRPDIMQLMADMKPSFLRFPGGNYLEGNMFSTRFPWKKTLGGLEHRPGHDGCWKYRSSDGMGLLEFLEWCEDLKMEPLLAVFAGYTLNKDYLDAGPLLKPFVDDALEEIEYVTGDVSTPWGARRAQDGHPAPFHLNYIEVGNEDAFDLSGSYERRFAQFYNAIRAKYPQLQIISTVGGKDPLGGRFPMPASKPELLDEHYYRNSWEMMEDAAHYDNYPRTGPKIMVGEWATREGFPTTNFIAAIGDAAWMTGMERNSDLVRLSCYAPLFVNVSPGAMQWKSDLIGYDALSSYGSPSYYAQKMFSNYIGDQVVPITAENIPTQLRKLNGRDSTRGMATDKQIPTLFFVATRNGQGGTIYLKVVNAAGVVQPVEIALGGKIKPRPQATQVLLKAANPEDTNTITEPQKIVPVVTKIKGISGTFSHNFPPYSITVLQLETK